VVGADALGVTDSITAFVARGLESIDFHVCMPSDPCSDATINLHSVARFSDSLLSVSVQTDDNIEYGSRSGRPEEWRAVADGIAFDVLGTLWSQNSPFAAWLPLGARPGPDNTAGFIAFVTAERLFNQTRWNEARAKYVEAIAADTSCGLCSWRITEIDRHHPGAGQDPTHVQRVLGHVESFPDHYQQLIQVENPELLPEERLNRMEAVVGQWPRFYYGFFRLGEELFNRGPFAGYRRRRATAPLERAVELRPEFGPGWEQLAWALIADGEEDKARAALARLQSLPEPEDAYSRAYGKLIGIGYDYRFEGEDAGGGSAAAALGDAEIRSIPEVRSAARLMPSFDAPAGAVHFGEGLVQLGLVVPGRMAQMFGHFQMGRVGDARGAARAVRRASDIEGFALFSSQLDAFLLMFDSAGADRSRDSVVSELRQHAAPGPGPPMQRQRALWTLALLDRRMGAGGVADSLAAEVASGPGPQPMAVLLEADRLAHAGDADSAWRVAEDLRRWEGARHVPNTVGPFFRSVLHLLRAEWHEELGNLRAARNELRWHEGWDQTALPIGAPHVEEVDWAFGTIARWRRAGVLEPMGDEEELCDVYHNLDRLWTDGDSIYAARADSARQRLDELGCAAGGR
jgi:hypothetical protein